MAMHVNSPLPLDGIPPGRLRVMADEARAVAEAAPGLREILEAVADAAERRLDRRTVDGIALPAHLEAPPRDVIVDQREAMARTVELRDDPSQPDAARAIWDAVVVRLAQARREAKAAMADRRRDDPSFIDLEEVVAAKEAAEASGVSVGGLEATPEGESGSQAPVAGEAEPAGEREPSTTAGVVRSPDDEDG